MSTISLLECAIFIFYNIYFSKYFLFEFLQVLGKILKCISVWAHLTTKILFWKTVDWVLSKNGVLPYVPLDPLLNENKVSDPPLFCLILVSQRRRPSSGNWTTDKITDHPFMRKVVPTQLPSNLTDCSSTILRRTGTMHINGDRYYNSVKQIPISINCLTIIQDSFILNRSIEVIPLDI